MFDRQPTSSHMHVHIHVYVCVCIDRARASWCWWPSPVFVCAAPGNMGATQPPHGRGEGHNPKIVIREAPGSMLPWACFFIRHIVRVYEHMHTGREWTAGGTVSV